MIGITIFTPTYNRGHLLGRVFDSLQSQVCKNFEWLIIDDGSKDDTFAIIRTFEQKAISEYDIIVRKTGKASCSK